MDKADLGLVKDWLTRAHQDLRASLILAAAENAPLDVAIYHCQQAGEKSVKAYLHRPRTSLRRNGTQKPQ